MYPYPASGTGLSAVLPTWTAAEGKLFDNLADPAMRGGFGSTCWNPAAVRRCSLPGAMPAGSCRLVSSGGAPAVCRPAPLGDCGGAPAGLDRRRLRPPAGRTPAHFHDLLSMTQDNLPMQLRQPWIKISTDAGGVDPAWAAEHGPVHPRGYGTYPRVLGRYVREQGVLTLEDAVRKMTSAVADRLISATAACSAPALCRCGDLRSGDDRRPRDLRRAAPTLHRCPRRLGQRQPRCASGDAHGSDAGAPGRGVVVHRGAPGEHIAAPRGKTRLRGLGPSPRRRTLQVGAANMFARRAFAKQSARDDRQTKRGDAGRQGHR